MNGQLEVHVEKGRLEEKFTELESEQSQSMKRHVFKLKVDQVRQEEKLGLHGGQALKKAESLPQTGRENGMIKQQEYRK